MKRNHKCIVTALLSLLIVLSMTGCGQQAVEKNQPQLVKSQKVGVGKDSSEAQYAGSVRGRYESNLSFQASGRILSRNVQLGSTVHAGDTLMVIDPKDLVQAVNQTQAAVDAAQAQLTLAESNYSRYQQLYSQNAISATALDQYRNAYEQAVASYQKAIAAQTQQQNQLSYTNLTADADGVVSAVTGEVGQVVAAGQTVLTLVHSDELEVEINVPENHVQDMTIGKEVSVSFWALKNQIVLGIVREVAPMADATARTYKVRISLPNPPSGMQLGMTANVSDNSTAPVQGGQTYVLPLAAIYQTGNVPKVWVIGEDKKLSLKTVSVEAFGDDQVKVTGLAQGDQIVTAGVHKLHEGEEVRTEGDGL